MRRLFTATFCGAGFALLLHNVCAAQITLIPGPQRQVASGPAFIASADFDEDGLADVVTSSVTRHALSILFGSPDGGFSSVVQIPVGRLLRGVTTGDFNGDGHADIAVLDLVLFRVFIFPGRGDGSFGSASSFTVDRRGPVDIAAGNFDKKNGPDLVTANSIANTITPLINQGGNRGFVAQTNIPTGAIPRAVATADFNGDGFDDIVILHTAARGTDELVLLLNNGTGSFVSVIPRTFTVGVGAKAITVNDFNGDGKPDVAVLNAGLGGVSGFSVTILLNDGGPVFSSTPPFRLSCPAFITGVPILCVPQDIKSADFDADGLIDLVVSFSTNAVSNNQVTAGFINAYAGRGDGTFDFGTQVLVGLGPRRIVAADTTGDANPDVVVTEFSNDTVRVLRSLKPPAKDNGGSCRLGTQCASGSCVDDTCCGSIACPAGQFCDVPGHRGTCSAPNSNGSPCDNAGQCASSFCVDGFCCGARTCQTGQFCNTGACGPPAGNGTQCNAGEQCSSTFCTDGVCCSSDRCPLDQSCNIPGFEGTCMARQPDGNPCTDPAQCESSFCTDGFCCNVGGCPAGQSCGIDPSQGVCVTKPTATATPTRTPTPEPNGGPCTSGTQCISTFCVDLVCCGTASCPDSQFCNVSSHSGMCANRGGGNSSCQRDTDCTSLNCQGGMCASTRTPTPTPSPTPLQGGDPCTSTSQCRFDLVCSSDEHVCCGLQTCPSGNSCRVPGHGGGCFPLPTATPTQRPSGAPCTDPAQCVTVSCVDGVCCDDVECLPGDRCDITGSLGFCSPPLGEGDECTKNTDCENGLLCLTDASSSTGARCSVPFTATPTRIATTAPTDTPGLIVSEHRSGGCSIGDRPDSSAVWILGALPIGLWLRQRSLQRVRVQRPRR